MKKHLITLVLTTLVQLMAFAQQEAKTKDGKSVILYSDLTWQYLDSVPLAKVKPIIIPRLEIPSTSSNDQIINHTGYSLLYNELHEQASWVAYELTKDETNSKYERTDKFLIDPLVKTKTATDKDYLKSGYDRGHLAPAGDMGWSMTSMTESFFYSNMSPQEPSFNRGIWKKLEEQVRTWANDDEAVYVVTGPVLTSGLSTIGLNKVSVPKHFYKVTLDYKNPVIKGIGFILPNNVSKDDLKSFAVTIDSVEKFTGIDFFPTLPNDQEDLIESTINLKAWSWESSSTANLDSEQKVTLSTQCKGITKTGSQCKNKTLNVSSYCYLHDSKINETSGQNNLFENQSKVKMISTTVQCSGITKAGSRCKRMTTNSSGRCYQH